MRTTNIRFREKREEDDRAWDILHKLEDLNCKSQSALVVRALNIEEGKRRQEVRRKEEQREPVSRTRDSMKNTESGLESPAEKTVTKQDYQRMTDAFMKLWNQAEKERDIPQNRGDYQRVLRR